MVYSPDLAHITLASSLKTKQLWTCSAYRRHTVQGLEQEKPKTSSHCKSVAGCPMTQPWRGDCQKTTSVTAMTEEGGHLGKLTIFQEVYPDFI